MPVILQISLGSCILILCMAFHVFISTKLIEFLRLKAQPDEKKVSGNMFKAVSGILLLLLFSHTVQIYVWAIALGIFGALPGYEEPIYFALVTYTTVGYGDVTLDASYRIFGAMASVNGIIAFGLTTAFLVGFFARFLGRRLN
jgi:hypothetical protein